mmetsp:Transcript_23299/g.51453  ORF Transcript_23299/g.51453 Transcript_23299/m.51453 type:complete len:430 (-) Transcript_23299:93-1382(-)
MQHNNREKSAAACSFFHHRKGFSTVACLGSSLQHADLTARRKGCGKLPDVWAEESEEAWPTEEDLAAAVSSLYDDQLKPYLSTLRSRLAEGRPKDRRLRNLNAVYLQKLCRSSPKLSLQLDHCSDCCMLLRDRQPDFVDVLSPLDVYPATLWEEAAHFFGSSQGALMEFRGGRYACAGELMALDLPFLRGYTHGQVSHIVQLAICQKKILGYSNYSRGAIVPYSRSAHLVKRTCADQRCSVASAASVPQVQLPVLTWEAAPSQVREILVTALREGAQYVPLSNIKRICRTVYHVDLSETALGHAKLSELLADSRFQEVCQVGMKARGYILFPSEQLLQSLAIRALDNSSLSSDGVLANQSDLEAFLDPLGLGLLQELEADDEQLQDFVQQREDEFRPFGSSGGYCYSYGAGEGATSSRGDFFAATPISL